MSVINIERQPRFTLYGAIVQSCMSSGAPMLYIEQTTLNEQLNVFADEVVDTSIVPSRDWFGVGWGSTYSRPNADSIDEIVNYIHDPLDANLFHLLPMVMREIGNDDLTPERRAQYGMRALVNKDGKTYVAYYLKKVDRSQTVITADIVVPPSTPDGTEQVDEVTGDPRYLNPTPVKLTTATERKDGAYVKVRSPVSMVFDPWEMNELLNAKQIMTASSQLEITEIGIFSGVPRDKTVTDGDSTFTYNEVMNAQLNLASPLRFIANDRVGQTTTLIQDMGINSPTNFKLPF